ncbi:hypothetical protein Tco_0828497 [Tanacetum coccineum]
MTPNSAALTSNTELKADQLSNSGQSDGHQAGNLKENVHRSSVPRLECQICKDPNHDKEFPSTRSQTFGKQVKYVNRGRLCAPFNESNGAKFPVGPLGYYTRIDNRPPYRGKETKLRRAYE